MAVDEFLLLLGRGVFRRFVNLKLDYLESPICYTVNFFTWMVRRYICPKIGLQCIASGSYSRDNWRVEKIEGR